MYHVFHALQVMFYLGNFDYFSDSAQPNWFGLVSAEIYVDDAQLWLLLVVTNVIAESWITLMLFWPNNFVTIYKVEFTAINCVVSIIHLLVGLQLQNI